MNTANVIYLESCEHVQRRQGYSSETENAVMEFFQNTLHWLCSFQLRNMSMVWLLYGFFNSLWTKTEFYGTKKMQEILW